MKKIVLEKIKSSSGETIAEVLVASLVIALGMILFAGMVNASFRLLTREQEKYAEFIEGKNEFERKQITEESERSSVKASMEFEGTTVNISESIPVDLYARALDDETTFYRYEPVNGD